jgi:hypothetical protein
MQTRRQLRAQVADLTAKNRQLYHAMLQDYTVILTQGMIDALRDGMTISIPRMEPTCWRVEMFAPTASMTRLRPERSDG